jgi:uncharacterized protein (DUF952 family)
MDLIYHSALPDHWEVAVQTGEYRQSTRDVTLEQEGFIHCSHAHQLERTLNKYYGDVDKVVLLEIDVARVGSEVLDEFVPAAEQSFPHIFGPLSVAAVSRAITWLADSRGRFSLADIEL